MAQVMWFVVVFFLASCSLSLQQTPPTLAKQFTTNWTLAAVNWVGQGTVIVN